MAWLESHQELADHPKTKRAARRLGIGIPQMIGHLHCLWYWAMDYAADGDLVEFSCADIAEAARWDDEPESFVLALTQCGTGSGPGFITAEQELNDWDEYGGKYQKRREQARDRQRRKREQARDSEASHADVTRDRNVSHTPRGQDSTKQEIREEGLNLAPKTARAREPDPVWDALAESVGKPATNGNRSNFGRVVKDLKSADATPDQILRFPAWWHRRFPDAALTVNCYANKNHWGEFINAPPEAPPSIHDIKDPFMRALMRNAQDKETTDANEQRIHDQVWRDEISPTDAHQLGSGSGFGGEDV